MRTSYQFKMGDCFSEVFTIEENADGTLIIITKLGRNNGYSVKDSAIQEARISVHYGTESPKYSTIKNHFRHEGELEKLKHVSLTSAIKTAGKFSLVLGVLCPYLLSESFRRPDGDMNKIVLGDFNALKGQVFYSIFVGNIDSVFPKDICEMVGVNLFQTCLGKIRIVIIWELVPFPITLLGHRMVPQTFRPEDLPEDRAEIMRSNMDGDIAQKALGLHLAFMEVCVFKTIEALFILGNNFFVFEKLDDSMKFELGKRKEESFGSLSEASALHYLI